MTLFAPISVQALWWKW